MNQPDKKSVDLYAMTWRLPIIVWQTIFFVGPLVFMVAMSFFLVRNYRMVEAFEFTNWERMLSRGYFWDSYLLTLGLASLSTIVAMTIAFPAAYALAFKVSDNAAPLGDLSC
jgi:spermidine/putrescine transport system permease protein